jgi:hypothetical protein
MIRIILALIIFITYCDIGYSQVWTESPKIKQLRQELEDQIIVQENETYYHLQEMEMEHQTENLKIKRQLKKMQHEIDDIRDSQYLENLR